MYGSVCMCTLSADVYGAEKRASHPLELELQAVVITLLWVLGTELRSSAKAICTLNQ